MGDLRLKGLPPIVGPDARVLILGSFPSEASLAVGEYYAHPRNQFWSIIGVVLGKSLTDQTFESKAVAVRQAGIAIWDTFARCRREGSLDAAIRAGEMNDFDSLFRVAPAIARVVFNGRLAARSAPWFSARGLRCDVMPSTSPACTVALDVKLARWVPALGDLSSAGKS